MRKPQPPKEITVKVRRPFILAGETLAVGAVIVLPVAFAQELITANKVERTKELPAASRDEPAAPIVEPKPAGKKGRQTNQLPVTPAQGV